MEVNGDQHRSLTHTSQKVKNCHISICPARQSRHNTSTTSCHTKGKFPTNVRTTLGQRPPWVSQCFYTKMVIYQLTVARPFLWISESLLIHERYTTDFTSEVAVTVPHRKAQTRNQPGKSIRSRRSRLILQHICQTRLCMCNDSTPGDACRPL